MKRKLDENGVPAAADMKYVSKESSTFDCLGLDHRLLQAVAQQNFSAPTLVQLKVVPLALEGKDILGMIITIPEETTHPLMCSFQLARRLALARLLHTSFQPSNRYCRENQSVTPVASKLCIANIATQTNATYKATSALILVPTHELAKQVSDAVSHFSAFCSKDVRAVNLNPLNASKKKVPESVQRSLLAEAPDVVIATPARASVYLQSSSFSVEQLTHLVIDEADLILSYGHDENLQVISEAVPQGVQTILMSATLSTEVDTLKGLFCRDPAVLNFQEAVEDSGGVSQYTVKYVIRHHC